MIARLCYLLLLTMPLTAWGNWDDVEAAGDYEGTWHIERLQPDHNRDYFEAHQNSSAMLRDTLGWDWPGSKASAERNLDTMEFHHQQHEDGEAFSYVLLTPEEGALVGAVFVAPVQARPDLPEFEQDEYTAEVTFWLNEAGQNHDAASDLLGDVFQWLEQEWELRSVLFPVATSNEFARREFSAHSLRLVHENQNNDELLYQFRAR